MYQKYIKRCLDVIICIIGFLILFPIFSITALFVRIKLGSPVIFKQLRIGKNGQIFTMYKFRTMTNKKDQSGNLLPDHQRLTSFGKKLRNTSLDELPELFNIIRGNMSLIGPRPVLIRDLTFMTEQECQRHRVRPGLTGLAQISGRNSISWDEKFAYDLEYIQKATLRLDTHIFFLTIGKVLTQDGINSTGMDSAELFGDYLLRKGRISQSEYNEKIFFAKQIIRTKNNH